MGLGGVIASILCVVYGLFSIFVTVTLFRGKPHPVSIVAIHLAFGLLTGLTIDYFAFDHNFIWTDFLGTLVGFVFMSGWILSYMHEKTIRFSNNTLNQGPRGP